MKYFILIASLIIFFPTAVHAEHVFENQEAFAQYLDISQIESEKISLTFDDTSYDFYYGYRGSLDSMGSNHEYPILDSLTVNSERKSLEVVMESVPEKTDFWLRMPESVITAEKENFTVLIDGVDTPYDLMKFPEDYVIGFIIDENTTQIEIIGTYVIPEFGVFAILILLVSLSAVILFQNKMKFSFN